MAAAAAAIAQALKAMGTVVRMKPEEFVKILNRAKDPLVVTAIGGLFGTNYQYLLSYRGLTFFTKADEPLELPESAEVVEAASIWLPG